MLPLMISHITDYGPRQKMTNYGPKQILDLNTLFERSLSLLSENHKIVEIESMVLKLWLLKDAQLHPT